MKRFIATVFVALLAGSALAAEHLAPLEPLPLVHPLPEIHGSLEARDPLMDSPSAGALPDLGSSDAASPFTERRPLPGTREPLFGERPSYLGPRPYWEYDPLFRAPLR